MRQFATLDTPAGADTLSALRVQSIEHRRWSAGTEVRQPLLCVSDTHLLPEETIYADDDPDGLCELISRFPDHAVAVLGDFVESLPLDGEQLDGLIHGTRLAPLFELLGQRHALIVAGNHDLRALPWLRARLGAQLFEAPVRYGPLVFLHGHEAVDDLSGAVNDIGMLAIPLGATLKRLGLSVDSGARNSRIAEAWGQAGFLVFGHTHHPELTSTFANAGCFLRREKTFLVFERDLMSLYGVET